MGGVGGALLAAGLAWYCTRRRKAAPAPGEGGLRTNYAGGVLAGLGAGRQAC